MLKKTELFPHGFHSTHFLLGPRIEQFVKDENWVALEAEITKLTGPQGRLFQFLAEYHEFNSIEFIISIRDAQNPWEEDGIWHDDGSRMFAFSLSLTSKINAIEGGTLGIRPKGVEEFSRIPTPEFGSIILFLTGLYGYEHKIHRVQKGKRIVIAGWCSQL